MATINFKIRPGKNKACPIYLIFSYGRGNELRYSTGYKVNDVNNWNSERQKVKAVVSEPYSNKINRKLKEIEIFFESRYYDLINDGVTINNLVLRNELNLFLGKKKKKETPTSYKTLLECYQWYFEYYSDNSLSTTKKTLAPGTIKSYKSAFKILKEFNDNMYSLSYTRIDLDFYSDFIEFMNKKGFAKNYISNNIKILKTIMNYAWGKKFHNNIIYKSKAFSKLNEEVQAIFLSEEELEKIENLKLEGRMDNVRDLFLIGAHTGLRVSDFNRLTSKNIKNNDGFRYIEIKSKKTNTLVAIPLKTKVLQILKKRNGNLPYKMPEQNINTLLKELGKKAEIEEKIEIAKTVGGKLTTSIYKKHQLITTHTARRSFCTNAYLAGMPTFDIMAISGHKIEKSFYKYIKASNLERLKKIAEHPFFK